MGCVRWQNKLDDSLLTNQVSFENAYQNLITNLKHIGNPNQRTVQSADNVGTEERGRIVLKLHVDGRAVTSCDAHD